MEMAHNKRIAAEQILNAKRQWDPTLGSDNARNKELNSNAALLREKFGLDDSRYGSGVTLEQAQRNFDKDFGSMTVSNTDVVTGNAPAFVMPEAPTMRSASSMANQLGIVYDLDRTRKLYQDAVDTKYANLDAEYGRTQDHYYDNIAANADILMDVMRRGDREAVMTGATRGTQAANEMGAILGASAEAGAGATELAQGRSDLVYQRENDLANVEKDALKYYNDLGINLGTVSTSELNALVTAYAAQVATAGGVYNTDVLANVERERTASQEAQAIADRISREDIATWQNASNEEVARQTGLDQKAVENIRAEYQTAINKATIESNEAIAAANRKAGGSSYGGGSYGGGSTGGGSTGGDSMDMDTQLRIQTIFGAMNKYQEQDTPESRRLMKALEEELMDLLGLDYYDIIKSTAEKASERPMAPILEGQKAPTPIVPKTRKELQDEAMSRRRRGVW